MGFEVSSSALKGAKNWVKIMGFGYDMNAPADSKTVKIMALACL